jgi:hypothetical protein
MVKSLRKFALVITVAVFLLSSVNFFLYIHLAEHKSDAGHDHNKCPTCQQAAINKIKAVIPNITAILELPQTTFTNIYKSETFVKRFNFRTPYLRAPPALS